MTEQEQAVVDYVRSSSEEYEEGPVSYLSEDVVSAYPWLFDEADPFSATPVIQGLIVKRVIDTVPAGESWGSKWVVL